MRPSLGGSMAERSTRVPGYVCERLPIARLVAARLFDHESGVRRGTVAVADVCDFTRDTRIPIEITKVAAMTAVAAIGSDVVQCEGRPGLNGRVFWTFRCPSCRRPCRDLHSPVGQLPRRCRECWRIARPSRSPRWRGVTPQQVAAAVAESLTRAEAEAPAS